MVSTTFKEVFIELTDKCNLSCDYCHKYWWNSFIEIKLFEKIISQIVNNHLSKIDFLCIWWWEPFLHPKIENIFQILSKYFQYVQKDFKIVINTNWILLKNNIQRIKKLAQNLDNINFVLYVSLDWYWINWNIYRKINHREYKIILENIDNILLINSHNLSLQISSVLNFQKWVYNISDFINFWNLKWVSINFCFQEMLYWKNKKLNKGLLLNILTKALFLYKNWYNIVIENSLNMNNVIRIDVFWNVYNFFDKSFFEKNNYKFLLSKNWDLDFLNQGNWELEIENDYIWSIIYRDKNYLKIINLFYSLYLKNKTISWMD